MLKVESPQEDSCAAIESFWRGFFVEIWPIKVLVLWFTCYRRIPCFQSTSDQTKCLAEEATEDGFQRLGLFLAWAHECLLSRGSGLCCSQGCWPSTRKIPIESSDVGLQKLSQLFY